MRSYLEIALVLLLAFAASSWTAMGIQNGYDVLSKDFTLNVFGNANMDNTIDESDIAYIEGVIDGTNSPTTFSDADFDGEIDSDDTDQIQKIIDGEDEELTFLDARNRTVTIKKPIGRVISLRGYDIPVIYMMGEQDKLIGIADWIAKSAFYKACMPDVTELSTLGSGSEPDYEKVVSLDPDLVIASTYYVDEIAAQLPSEISVACFDFTTPETMREEMTKIGYLFDKKGWESAYFDLFHDKYMGLILSRTSDLTENDRPVVYKEWNSKAYATFPYQANEQMTDFAGGILLFSEIETSKSVIEISPEDIISRNPDVILKDASSSSGDGYTGFDIDDPEKPKPLRDEIMNRTELAAVSAVENGDVYILDTSVGFGTIYPVGIAYLARWLHPDLFEDLDTKEVLQTYMDLLGSDYDAMNHGVFVYPPPEVS